jgi:hypothetical protein
LGLIGENENFALFDNGNLYAKNAWIEGNIRATSGNISGKLVVGPESSQTLIGSIYTYLSNSEGIYVDPNSLSEDEKNNSDSRQLTKVFSI